MAEPTPSELTEPGISVSLTHAALSPTATMNLVRSPSAGAIVLFAGTTRDTFGSRAVLNLAYESYVPLALQTMLAIARSQRDRHALEAVAIVHRLGVVPIGEESVLIAVSSPHRRAAWLAGEECLEEVKARVEVWKLETFVGDEGGGVWRANRDGVMGVGVEAAGEAEAEAEGITSQLRGGGEEGGHEGVEGDEGSMGPVVRPRRLGEKGHGAVVNPKPEAESE